jgi:hypothetical protein
MWHPHPSQEQASVPWPFNVIQAAFPLPEAPFSPVPPHPSWSIRSTIFQVSAWMSLSLGSQSPLNTFLRCHTAAVQLQWGLRLWSWVLEWWIRTGTQGCAGSNGVVYFLKRVFKQCRQAGRTMWQSPGFLWPLYWDWLSRCYGYKPKGRTSWSQDWVFPVPSRERTGLFSNYPFALLQSLLELLHKSYSDSVPFQEALGVLRSPTPYTCVGIVIHEHLLLPLARTPQGRSCSCLVLPRSYSFPPPQG